MSFIRPLGFSAATLSSKVQLPADLVAPTATQGVSSCFLEPTATVCATSSIVPLLVQTGVPHLPSLLILLLDVVCYSFLSLLPLSIFGGKKGGVMLVMDVSAGCFYT